MPLKDSKRAKRGRWAPGNYECACAQCGAHFIGDKRAMVCAVCAYEAQLDNPPKSEVDTLRAQLAERDAEIAELRNALADQLADTLDAKETIARQSAALAGRGKHSWA